ncbi:Hypothetical_protein [Hexamita inflata]|uniref:Hypothetical_protein n=1 Tax=Hexamita inflata TaxID=28002 RepID=A0AA86Q3R1_9EUKA|nr:Hypothetical protein HINF_LOCUS39305 [Hexamita inflata]
MTSIEFQKMQKQIRNSYTKSSNDVISQQNNLKTKKLPNPIETLPSQFQYNTQTFDKTDTIQYGQKDIQKINIESENRANILKALNLQSYQHESSQNITTQQQQVNVYEQSLPLIVPKETSTAAPKYRQTKSKIQKFSPQSSQNTQVSINDVIPDLNRSLLRQNENLDSNVLLASDQEPSTNSVIQLNVNDVHDPSSNGNEEQQELSQESEHILFDTSQSITLQTQDEFEIFKAKILEENKEMQAEIKSLKQIQILIEEEVQLKLQQQQCEYEIQIEELQEQIEDLQFKQVHINVKETSIQDQLNNQNVDQHVEQNNEMLKSQSELQENNAQLETVLEENKALREQVDNLCREQEEITEMFNQYRTEINSISAKKEEDTRKIITELGKQIQEKEDRIEQLLKDNQQDLENTGQKELEILQSAIDDKDDQIIQLQNELKQSLQSIMDLEQQQTSVNQSQRKPNVELYQIHDAIDKKNEIIQLQTELSSQIQYSDDMEQKFELKILELQIRNEELMLLTVQLQDSMQLYEKKIESQQQVIAEKEQLLQSDQFQQDELHESLKQKISGLNDTIVHQDQRYAELEQQYKDQLEQLKEKLVPQQESCELKITAAQSQFEKETSQLREQLQQIQTKADELVQRLGQEQDGYSQLEAKYQDSLQLLEQVASQHEQEISGLKSENYNQIQQTEQILSGYRQYLENLTQKLDVEDTQLVQIDAIFQDSVDQMNAIKEFTSEQITALNNLNLHKLGIAEQQQKSASMQLQQLLANSENSRDQQIVSLQAQLSQLEQEYQNSLNSKNQQIESEKQSAQALQTQLTELQASNAQLSAELQQHKEQHQSDINSLNDEHSVLITSLNQQIQSLQNCRDQQIISLQQQLSQLEQEYQSALKKQIDDEKQSALSYQTKLQLLEQASLHEQKISNLKSDNFNLLQQIELQNETIKQLSNQKQFQNDQNLIPENILEQKQQSNLTLNYEDQVQKEELKQAIYGNNIQIQVNENVIDMSKAEIINNANENQQLKLVIEANKTEFAELETKFNQWGEQLVCLGQQSNKDQQLIAEQNEKILLLQSQIQELQHNNEKPNQHDNTVIQSQIVDNQNTAVQSQLQVPKDDDQQLSYFGQKDFNEQNTLKLDELEQSNAAMQQSVSKQASQDVEMDSLIQRIVNEEINSNQIQILLQQAQTELAKSQNNLGQVVQENNYNTQIKESLKHDNVLLLQENEQQAQQLQFNLQYQNELKEQIKKLQSELTTKNTELLSTQSAFNNHKEQMRVEIDNLIHIQTLQEEETELKLQKQQCELNAQIEELQHHIEELNLKLVQEKCSQLDQQTEQSNEMLKSQSELQENNAQLETVLNENKALKEQVDSLCREQEEITEMFNQYRTEINSISAKKEEDTRKIITELGKQIQEKEDRIEQLLKDNQQDLENTSKKELEILQDAIDSKDDQIIQLQNELKKTLQSSADLELQLAVSQQIDKQDDELHDALDKKDEEIIQLQTELTSQKKSSADLEQQLTSYKQQFELKTQDFHARNDELGLQIAELQDSMQLYEKKIESQQQVIAEKEQLLQSDQFQQDELHESLKQKISGLNDTIVHQDQRYAELEQQYKDQLEQLKDRLVPQQESCELKINAAQSQFEKETSQLREQLQQLQTKADELVQRLGQEQDGYSQLEAKYQDSLQLLEQVASQHEQEISGLKSESYNQIQQTEQILSGYRQYLENLTQKLDVEDTQLVQIDAIFQDSVDQMNAIKEFTSEQITALNNLNLHKLGIAEQQQKSASMQLQQLLANSENSRDQQIVSLQAQLSQLEQEYQNSLNSKNQQIESEKQSAQALQTQLTELQASNAQLSAELQQHKEQHQSDINTLNNEHSELTTSLNQQIQNIQTLLNQKSLELETSKQNILDLEQKQKQIFNQNETRLQELQNEYKKHNEELQLKNNNLMNQLKETSDVQITELQRIAQTRVDQVMQSNQDLLNQISILNEKNKAAEIQNSKLEMQVSSEHTKQEQLQKQLEQVREECQETQRQLKGQTILTQTAEAEVKRKETNIQQLQQQLFEAQQDHQTTIQQLHVKEQETAAKAQKLQELAEEIQELEQKAKREELKWNQKLEHELVQFTGRLNTQKAESEQLKSQLQVKEDTVQIKETQIQAAKQQLARLQEDLDGAQFAAKQLERQYEEKLRQQLDGLSSENEQLKKAGQQLKNEVQTQLQENEQTLAQVRQLKKQVEEEKDTQKQAEIDFSRSQRGNLSQIKSLQEDLSAKEQQVTTMKKKVEELQEAVRENDARVAQVQKERQKEKAELLEQLDAQESAAKKLKREVQALQEEQQSKPSQPQHRISPELEELQEENASLKTTIEELRNLRKQQREEPDGTITVEKLKDELQDTKTKLEKADQKIKISIGGLKQDFSNLLAESEEVGLEYDAEIASLKKKNAELTKLLKAALK